MSKKKKLSFDDESYISQCPTHYHPALIGVFTVLLRDGKVGPPCYVHRKLMTLLWLV